MRAQLRYVPDKVGHRTLGVTLAALSTILAANAVAQNPPVAVPSNQTKKSATTATNQPPRSVATPNTQAPRATTTPPPKQSLLQRWTGPFKHPASDTSSQPQPNLWNKMFPGSHSGSSSEQPHSETAMGGHSHAPPAPQVHPVPERAPANAPGARDNGLRARDLQNPQHVQHLASIDPNSSIRNPALVPPARQSRPFPSRPAVPSSSETRMANGNVVRTAADGSVTDLHSSQHNMSVHYGLNGSRQVRVDQPDGSRIVLASRGVPYMQKPWNFGSRAFDHRTFVDNGQLRSEFYRPYTYGDTSLDVYAPQRFYSQEFYQWVAKPQAWTPPAWTYVTKQESWYAHYQSYFTAQPSYDSPVLWLTDFVLAMSLFEAYNAHQLSAHAPPAPPTAVPAATPQPSAQTASASAPIVQPPVAQTRSASAATQAPIVALPTAAAATTQSPIVTLPASSAISAQTPIAALPADAIARTSGSADATSTPQQGATLTLWERFSNFIRGLFGQTPAQPAPVPLPVAVPAEPVVAESVAPITSDVKALVADEVGRQIEEESREARGNAQNEEPKPGAGGIVEELRRRSQHVFVVASDLDLVDDSGRRCMISEGDVVQIISAVNAKTGTAQGVVLSSKGGVECAHAATVDIAVVDLQEMQNHMRATIDQGLANTPRGATEPTVTPAFAAAAPPPDVAARSAIEQQKQIATTVDSG